MVPAPAARHRLQPGTNSVYLEELLSAGPVGPVVGGQRCRPANNGRIWVEPSSRCWELRFERRAKRSELGLKDCAASASGQDLLIPRILASLPIQKPPPHHAPSLAGQSLLSCSSAIFLSLAHQTLTVTFIGCGELFTLTNPTLNAFHDQQI